MNPGSSTSHGTPAAELSATPREPPAVGVKGESAAAHSGIQRAGSQGRPAGTQIGTQKGAIRRVIGGDGASRAGQPMGKGDWQREARNRW
jgi:hypothetical protein